MPTPPGITHGFHLPWPGADVEDFRVRVSRQGQPRDAVHRLQIGICNRSPGGGHLGKQIECLLATASGRKEAAAIPVIVRSADYRPKGPNARIAQTFRQLFDVHGRYVIVSDSHWRTMLAMRRFRAKQATAPQFAG